LKYFLHISYNGTRYQGWQRQPKAISVQQVLEEAMIQLLKENLHLSSCSRTDAGVHAIQFFAHFKTEKELDQKHVYFLNKILPGDISVHDIVPVNRRAHAQKDVIKRSYDYFLHFNKEPMLFDKSTYYDLPKLDTQKMKQACNLLLTTKDFRSLCKRPDTYKTTVCDLSEAKLFFSNDHSRMRFHVTSDRFLQGMIRLIIGRLLQIGSGKLELEEFANILSSGKSIPSKLAAYPQGLYLSKIIYPYLELKPKGNFLVLLCEGLKEIP
jgi:tRNA pseudouridine38-40 synthase